jgi:hypothetical protein
VHLLYEARPRCRGSRRRARSCAGSRNEAHRDALARMAGRLQPREAEALSGEARCEGNGGGSSDRGEVYFTAAKLSLVKHHDLGAFRCPFLRARSSDVTVIRGLRKGRRPLRCAWSLLPLCESARSGRLPLRHRVHSLPFRRSAQTE